MVKKQGTSRGRSAGSVMDVLTVSIYILVLTIVMLAYLGSVQIINCKAQISQISRKYILRMETVGYLTEDDRRNLEQELRALGVVSVLFTGSTLEKVEFGSPIYLVIHGRISTEGVDLGTSFFDTVFRMRSYEFEDKKMSTAKN